MLLGEERGREGLLLEEDGGGGGRLLLLLLVLLEGEGGGGNGLEPELNCRDEDTSEPEEPPEEEDGGGGGGGGGGLGFENCTASHPGLQDVTRKSAVEVIRARISAFLHDWRWDLSP